MAEKPPEEGYISVVDEEPEILELLKWDNPAGLVKQPEPPCMPQPQEPEPEPEKPKSPEKKGSKQEVDPFDLPEPSFIETYRLSKDLARSLIEELKPIMPETSNNGSGNITATPSPTFTLESKILVALSFYATGKFQKSVAGKTDPNITQYFVSTAVTQVTEALNHPTIVKKHIHFPHLREERDLVKAKFYMKYGIPNVVGCVDVTHVPIFKPDDDQKSHFNKSYHSKKVQIICDSDLTILSVDPSPGAHSHDGILARHAVTVDLKSINDGGETCWLLGGPFYSVKPYLMTPIPKITKKSPVCPEKHFNTLHAQTHSLVKDTIKHLKSRWKCLQCTCNKAYDAPMVSMMIVACCILHNLCNRRGLPVCQFTQTEERLEAMKQKVANGPISKKQNEDEEAVRVRAQLVERLWGERRVPVPDGPKKRQSRKDRILEAHQSQTQSQSQQTQTTQTPPAPPPVQMAHQLPPPPPLLHHHHQQQQHPQHPQQQQQQQHQLVQADLDEGAKRARLGMPPPHPHYPLMPPGWGHYPHH